MFPDHGRKPNRLKEYDYSEDGFYFITICAKNRIECFGDIKNGEMVLNKYGQVAEKQWQWLAGQYSYVKLDEFIIMPNHVHGIVVIDSPNAVGTGRDLSLHINIKLLSDLMGAFKTTSSKLIHQSGFSDFSWQRSFYDRIIYNEQSLMKIREYIRNNPLKWELDRNNSENLFI
ncbi:MAG: transposase [Patescibacteria group bacterium]